MENPSNQQNSRDKPRGSTRKTHKTNDSEGKGPNIAMDSQIKNTERGTQHSTRNSTARQCTNNKTSINETNKNREEQQSKRPNSTKKLNNKIQYKNGKNK